LGRGWEGGQEDEGEVSGWEKGGEDRGRMER